jgi:rfaE bifunctional protein nucleotidyltransferase chain/domain
VKTRLRSGGQTVARLDRGSRTLAYEGLPEPARAAICDAAAVLVSDYGGGLSAHDPLRILLAARARTRPLVWDPHPRGAIPVPGVRLATPNGREASAASGVAGDRIGDRRRQADALRQMWRVRSVAVTLGAAGALLAYGDGATEFLPADAQPGHDANGAGDCFAAAATVSLAASGLPSEAVAAGVTAASRYVAADGEPLALTGLARDADGEVRAGDVVAAVRRRGGTVVATGGCFDLLHPGHIATLAAARTLGDCLVVCLNSDASVRRLKGDNRPLQSAADRARVLTALRYVDAVVVFDEDTPGEVLSALRPDVWVKGGDYSAAALPEAALVRSWGGEVVTVPYLAGRSTSQLVGSARQ